MTEINFTMSDATFGVVMIIGFVIFILGLWLGITVEQLSNESENIPNLTCEQLSKYILDEHFNEKPIKEYLVRCSKT